MRKTMLVLALVLMLVTPTMSVLADTSYPNEAITELRAVFTGTSGNITLKVYASFNDAAVLQGGDLRCRLTIDSHVVSENISVTDLTEGYDVEWDTDVYTGDYHTITVEFVNPNEDVSVANLADNKLTLGVATPGSSLAALLNVYGQLEYIISKTTRQSLNGWFSFFADYPLYIWLIALVFIVIIIWVVIRWRKNKRRGPFIPPRYKGYIKI